MLSDASPLVDGDGRQSRDFTFVSNVVNANISAALAAGGPAGEVFNVACGESYSILDIIDNLNTFMKKKIDIEKSLRKTGSYEMAVKLASDLNPQITVVIEEEKETETEAKTEKKAAKKAAKKPEKKAEKKPEKKAEKKAEKKTEKKAKVKEKERE